MLHMNERKGKEEVPEGLLYGIGVGSSSSWASLWVGRVFRSAVSRETCWWAERMCLWAAQRCCVGGFGAGRRRGPGWNERNVKDITGPDVIRVVDAVGKLEFADGYPKYTAQAVECVAQPERVRHPACRGAAGANGWAGRRAGGLFGYSWDHHRGRCAGGGGQGRQIKVAWRHQEVTPQAVGNRYLLRRRFHTGKQGLPACRRIARDTKPSPAGAGSLPVG